MDICVQWLALLKLYYKLYYKYFKTTFVRRWDLETIESIFSVTSYNFGYIIKI